MSPRLTLLDRLLLRFSPALRRAVNGPAFGMQVGPGGQGVSIQDDDTYVAEAYQWIPAMYAGVFAIAHSVAQVPVDVYRRRKSGKLEVIGDHPLKLLLDAESGNCNPFFPAYSLHEEMQSFLELAGNAFWLLAGGRAANGGIPEQIYSLPPHRVKPIPGTTRPVDGYEYDLGQGKKKKYAVEEIVHFRYFNPLSQVIGQSSGRAVREEILIEVFAKGMNRLFFKNGATLSGVLEVEDHLDKTEARAILEQFHDTHTGWWNSFKTRLLSGGAEYKPIQPAHKDMLFYEGMKWTREQILMVLGVPPIMVTLMDGATYANAHEQRQQFWQTGILPKLRMRDAALNLHLVPRYGPGLVLKSNLGGIEALKQSLEQLTAPLERLQRMGALSRNEIRQWASTGQMPELKPLPDGDEYYMPIGMISLSDTGEDDPEQPILPPPAEGGEDPADPNDERAIARFLARCAEDGRQMEVERQERATRAKAHRLDQAVDAAAPVYRRAVRTVFKAQERVLLDNIDRIARAAGPGLAEVRENRGLDDIDDILAGMRSGSAGRIEQALRALVDQFGSASLTDLGLEGADVVFDMLSERVLLYVSNTAAQKVVLVDRTTAATVKGEIQKALLKAQAEGANIVDTASEIMEAGIRSGMGIRRARANAIAQTETTAAYNFSDSEAWIQSGAVETKIWRTQADENVRDSHEAAEGMEVNVTSPFVIDGQSLMHPGDPAGSADEVVGCRCFMEPGKLTKSRPSDLAHLREICALLDPATGSTAT
jgi:HK97 family phage portal protein